MHSLRAGRRSGTEDKTKDASTIEKRKKVEEERNLSAKGIPCDGSADASGLSFPISSRFYWEFARGVLLPTTGVLLQNRGRAFARQRALNALPRPSDRFSTLNPSLARSQRPPSLSMAHGGMVSERKRAVHAVREVRSAAGLAPSTRPRCLLAGPGGRANNVLQGSAVRRPSIDRLVSAGPHDIEVFFPSPIPNVMALGAVVLHPRDRWSTHDPLFRLVPRGYKRPSR